MKPFKVISLTVLMLAPFAGKSATAETLYEAEFAIDSVTQTDPAGVTSTFRAETPSGTVAVAVDSSGNVYVVGRQATTIQKYSPSGASLGTFASTGLNDPFALEFNKAGNLFVVNHGSAGDNKKSIHEYGPTGIDLGTFASSNLSEPTDIAFDSQQNVYVMDLGSEVRKYAPDGTDLGAFVTPSGFGNSITFDSANNLFVATDGNQILKYPVGTTNSTVFASTGLSMPISVEFGQEGNLYVSNSISETVRRFAPDGTDLGNFATGLDSVAGIAFGPGLPEPVGTAAILFSGAAFFLKRIRA